VIPQGCCPRPFPHFDLRVVAVLLARLCVGVLFGLAPAWQVTELSSPGDVVDSRTTTGRGGSCGTHLGVIEVATAVCCCSRQAVLRTLIAVDSVVAAIVRKAC